MRSTLIAALLLLTGCADASGPAISGTISMKPELQEKLGASDTLFIVAKPKEGGGPPLAVQRIVGATYPLEYKFTQEDVLRPGTPLQGTVTVSALVRKSGVVTVVNPGDLSGRYAQPVEVGADHVDFAIDDVQP
jgi:cytochrome c-type biogenesis protein CcmH